MARRPVGRVVARRSFQALRRPSWRAGSGPLFVAYVVPQGEPAPARVAFAVSRRCGGAVQRNKIRRRLRGAVGELADGLLPGTYLVRTDPAVAATSYQELVGRLRECLARIAELSKEGTR